MRNYNTLKTSIEATKLRRSKLTCKVYETKIMTSKLSKTSLKHLNKLFLEAKWLYNHVISSDDITKINTTHIKEVPVKVKDVFETRQLDYISSQMKQSIKTRAFDNVMGLSASKKQGRRIGKLKFKSFLNSIPLVQFGTTYKLDFDKSRIRVQGIKQWLKVKGLDQVAQDFEFANATLIKKPDGYYVHLTTYQPRETKIIPDISVGIDFGCQTQLTLSDETNSLKIEYQVPVSKRLKRLDRKISKKSRPRSNNKYKDQIKRQQEYQKLNNRKKDIRHKVVSCLTNNFKTICFQDESIHAWATGRHGKKIQNTGIGGILSDLKNKSHTPILVSKFFPSTQLCPSCGIKNKLDVSERIYECSCGYKEDRDTKSALCILREGLKQQETKIPTEYRKFKPGEIWASVFDTLNNIQGVKCKSRSMSQEAAML
jgi:putative transposase